MTDNVQALLRGALTLPDPVGAVGRGDPAAVVALSQQPAALGWADLSDQLSYTDL